MLFWKKNFWTTNAMNPGVVDNKLVDYIKRNKIHC